MAKLPIAKGRYGCYKRLAACLLNSGLAAWAEPVAAESNPCANGIVVSEPQDYPGLVANCEVLLGLRDHLAGDRDLNWSADIPITQWDGIAVGDSGVKTLELGDRELTGVIPPALGRLTELEELNLDGNALIGCAPEPLARWVNDLPVCSQVAKSSDAAVSAVTATVLGDGIEHLIVEFARTIPGRQPDYAWIGVTDEFGQLELMISSEAPVSGYYQARGRNADGEMVGQWHNIFFD